MIEYLEGPGTYIIVCRNDDMALNVTDSIDSVDARTQEWLSSGKTRDSWVSLTNIDGDEVRVLASSVTALILSTPEGRRRQAAFRFASQEEQKVLRAEAGFPPGDEF
jgi:hypothetical protein